MKCQICLRNFKKLRFRTKRIGICGRCVKALNEYHETAEVSHDVFLERYRSVVVRNAEVDLQSDIESVRHRARWTLHHLEEVLAKNFPRWLNKILGDPRNVAKEYKIMRAFRRGILHWDEPRSKDYRNDFEAVAKTVRLADRFDCMECAKTEVELHVHHIIYKSNYGTDKKQNLITLCKSCHENEHGRNFDSGKHQEINELTDVLRNKVDFPCNAAKIERRNLISWESKLKTDAVNYVVSHLSELNGKCLLSGEDSGLQNVWEEICVQVQFDESFYWSAYQELIQESILDFLEKLDGHERLILWSTTNDGWDWIYDHPESNRDDAPLDEMSIVSMLMPVVCAAAYAYENEAISRFSEGFHEGDRDFTNYGID